MFLKFGRRRAVSASRQQEREIYVNSPLPTSILDSYGAPINKYVSNKVITSKYSVVSFLPKNLFEQFRRFANIFFLLLIILQTFKEFATVDPFISALPVIVITLITAAKDGVEDWKRHITDNQVNTREVQTLGGWKNVNYDEDRARRKRKFRRFFKNLFRTTKPAAIAPRPETALGELTGSQVSSLSSIVGHPVWKGTKWEDVRVGDFVLLKNNDFIPADMVILSTSEPDCVCYVETKNLDGETNLKVRKGPMETFHIKNAIDCGKVKFIISSEKPNNNMFSYNGTMLIEDPGIGLTLNREQYPRKIPINMSGMLLRGCILRNTEWVIGLAIYTGRETKIRLNAGETPSKRSIIEILMNPQVLSQLGLLAVICIVCAIAHNFWVRFATNVNASYWSGSADSQGYTMEYAAFLAFWSSLIAFQNIVPIALYLTVETIKTMQAYFIYSDVEMYHSKTDTPCVPKSWNLSDDLGQIEYIFSDKTGTLTRNVMEYRKCSINGKVYGTTLPRTPTSPAGTVQVDTTILRKRSRYASKQPTFFDSQLIADLDSGTEHSEFIGEFFTLLAVCHTVLASKANPDDQFDIQYKAQSPDEAALVQTARDMGFAFVGRQMTDVHVDVCGTVQKFALLAVLEFNSTRKRMSVIVRNENGDIVLYCKGADTVIYERLLGQEDQSVPDTTLEHLECFAEEGLRTLCLACRIIPEEEFIEWAKVYHEACTSLQDREDKIDAAAELIERDLVLLGATAIEDRLQDGVPECIATLREAGIKVWVLTGDKMETAISIGFSCNLLTKDMNLIVIKGGANEPTSTQTQLTEAWKAFFGSGENLKKLKTGHLESDFIIPSSTTVHALIIDGQSLKYALDEEMKTTLLELACKCSVVICCRVSPLQKAQVVTLVKNGKQAVTCAIGDGANDVSMIQAAHVGVGISGQEGMQAVMSSDYAIAQFRFLSRLLLVHGRWSYFRTGEAIYNYFYKDIIFVFLAFWFQFLCGFSTQEPYEFTYMLFYNLFFTCWPVFILGIFDQDVPAKYADKAPRLYMYGIRQTVFTGRRFIWYIWEGLYQSAVCFLIPYGIYYNNVVGDHGRPADMLEMGTTMAVAAIVNANLFTALNMQSWTFLNHIAIWGSILLIYAYAAVFSTFEFAPTYGLYQSIFATCAFWLGVLLCSVVCQLPRYAIYYYQRNYYPTDIQIVQEIDKYNLESVAFRPSITIAQESVVQAPSNQSAPVSTEDPGQSELHLLPPVPLESPTKKSPTTSHKPIPAPIIIPATPPKSQVTDDSLTSSPESTSLPPLPQSSALAPQSPTHKHSNSAPAQSYMRPPLSAQSPIVNRLLHRTHLRSLSSDYRPRPNASAEPKSPGHITNMKTLTMLRNRGYSFSQDESGGMRSILMCESYEKYIAARATKKRDRKASASEGDLLRSKTLPTGLIRTLSNNQIAKSTLKSGIANVNTTVPRSPGSPTSSIDPMNESQNSSLPPLTESLNSSGRYSSRDELTVPDSMEKRYKKRSVTVSGVPQSLLHSHQEDKAEESKEGAYAMLPLKPPRKSDKLMEVGDEDRDQEKTEGQHRTL
ncbi:hypothetical protein BKA69DRAFT_1167692 [Paraphysoderma sedebokerense]|nr:hypothetical protein BKA69DRAFT_1167692 [Paraphysoderma sedebokerense]